MRRLSATQLDLCKPLRELRRSSRRQRFFEAAIAGNVRPDRASRIWNNAIFGHPLSRRLVEEKGEIEIVAADLVSDFSNE